MPSFISQLRSSSGSGWIGTLGQLLFVSPQTTGAECCSGCAVPRSHRTYSAIKGKVSQGLSVMQLQWFYWTKYITAISLSRVNISSPHRTETSWFHCLPAFILYSWWIGPSLSASPVPWILSLPLLFTGTCIQEWVGSPGVTEPARPRSTGLKVNFACTSVPGNFW